MRDSDQAQTTRTVTCTECGCPSDEYWSGWRASRCDEPEFGDAPQLAFYCPVCAEREFGRRAPRPLD